MPPLSEKFYMRYPDNTFIKIYFQNFSLKKLNLNYGILTHKVIKFLFKLKDKD